MNIKLIYHMMPWEIDYMGLSFTSLKETLLLLRNIPSLSHFNFTIDSTLNLSSHIINWNKSKLPKEYFIEKYDAFSLLLRNPNHPKWGLGDDKNEYLCKHNQKVYEGDGLYGHLDLQRDCIGKEFDYYMHLCPDLKFSPFAIISMLEGAILLKRDSVPNFVITPSIFKMWDNSWDKITHPKYNTVNYDDWWKVDSVELGILEELEYYIGTPPKNPLQNQYRQISPKWAGWCDLYSKDLYENMMRVPKGWKGYGGWDLYSMLSIVHLQQNQDLKFTQLVTNHIVTKHSLGPLNTTNKPANTGNWLQSPTKNHLSLKNNVEKENQMLNDEEVIKLVNKNVHMILNDKKIVEKMKLTIGT